MKAIPKSHILGPKERGGWRLVRCQKCGNTEWWLTSPKLKPKDFVETSKAEGCMYGGYIVPSMQPHIER